MKVSETAGERPNSGLCFHVQDDRLWGWCYNIQGRHAVIDMAKPQQERASRHRLLKLVIWPDMPEDVANALAAYVKVEAAYDKVLAAYLKAWAAYDKELALHQDTLVRLHAEQCPDCPWDGQTIFPQKVYLA